MGMKKKKKKRLTLTTDHNYSSQINGDRKSRHQRSVTLSADIGRLMLVSSEENLLHGTKPVNRQERRLTLSSSPSSLPNNNNRVHDLAKLFGSNQNETKSKKKT